MGNEFQCIGRIRSVFIEAFIFVLAYPVQFMHGEKEHWHKNLNIQTKKKKENILLRQFEFNGISLT
jgi:hypothetical protein